MNKVTKSLLVILIISSIFSTSALAWTDKTFAWSNIGSFVADDSTPAIPFMVYGNNSSYTCNLYLNLSGVWTAAGTVEATNNTLSEIVCNYTLSPWTTYSYNITAYNVSDHPNTFTSSTYTVRYSSFKMFATMITEIGGIFNAMVALVVAIIIITVVLAIAGGLVNGFGGMFGTIFSFLRFGKR